MQKKARISHTRKYTRGRGNKQERICQVNHQDKKTKVKYSPDYFINSQRTHQVFPEDPFIIHTQSTKYLPKPYPLSLSNIFLIATCSRLPDSPRLDVIRRVGATPWLLCCTLNAIYFFFSLFKFFSLSFSLSELHVLQSFTRSKALLSHPPTQKK